MAAVGAAEWGTAVNLVVGQVVACDEGAVLFEGVNDRVCELALIEVFRSGFDDALEGAGHVRVSVELAALDESIFVAEPEGGGIGGGAEDFARRGQLGEECLAEVHGHVFGQGEPIAACSDGRFEEFGPGECSMAAVEFGEAGDGTGCHDGGVAEVGAVVVEEGEMPDVGVALNVIDPDIGAHFRADARPEAEMFRLVVLAVEEGCTAPTAESALDGVHGRLHEPGGDRCVEGVAAAAEDFGAGFGRHGFGGGDDSVGHWVGL